MPVERVSRSAAVAGSKGAASIRAGRRMAFTGWECDFDEDFDFDQRASNVVVVGADRDLGLDQGSRFGLAVALAVPGGFHRCRQPVDAASADGFEAAAQRVAQPAVLPLVVRQPDLDPGRKKLAAGRIGRASQMALTTSRSAAP